MEPSEPMCGQSQKQVVTPLADAEIEMLANVCHEANRAYCVANGDTSQPAWADAPDWQRASAISGVRFVAKEGGYIDPRRNHDRWMGVKLRDGWRWGTVKDVANKTHPCLLPWDELPPPERVKDEIFIGIVRGYCSSMGKG